MGKKKWMDGVVVAQKGSRHYLLRVDSNVRYVNIDHILSPWVIFSEKTPYLCCLGNLRQRMSSQYTETLGCHWQQEPRPTLLPPFVHHSRVRQNWRWHTIWGRGPWTNHQTLRWPFRLQYVIQSDMTQSGTGEVKGFKRARLRTCRCQHMDNTVLE